MQHNEESDHSRSDISASHTTGGQATHRVDTTHTYGRGRVWAAANTQERLMPIISRCPLCPHLARRSHEWFLLSPAGSIRGFFSDTHCGDLVKFLKVKLTKVWWPSYDWTPWSFPLPDLSTWNFQQFVDYILVFPTLILVLAEVSAGEFLLL